MASWLCSVYLPFKLVRLIMKKERQLAILAARRGTNTNAIVLSPNRRTNSPKWKVHRHWTYRHHLAYLSMDDHQQQQHFHRLLIEFQYLWKCEHHVMDCRLQQRLWLSHASLGKSWFWRQPIQTAWAESLKSTSFLQRWRSTGKKPNFSCSSKWSDLCFSRLDCVSGLNFT